jgi:hypothetical protein
MLTVYYGNGTSSGASVYLGGKCQADFDDLRFTSSNGSGLLDYWLESKTNSTSAIVWVEVASIPTTGATIYLYYGNSGASSASSGDNTFALYDNFDGNLNTSKWGGFATMNAGTNSDSEHRLISNSNYLATGSTSTFNQGYAIHVRATMARAEYSYIGWATTGFAKSILLKSYGTCNRFNINSVDQAVLSPEIDNNYHILDIQRLAGSTNNMKVFVDYSGTAASVINSADTDSMSLIAHAAAPNGAVVMDWVAVHKITANEPTASTWGNEQYYATVPASRSRPPPRPSPPPPST